MVGVCAMYLCSVIIMWSSSAVSFFAWKSHCKLKLPSIGENFLCCVNLQNSLVLFSTIGVNQSRKRFHCCITLSDSNYKTLSSTSGSSVCQKSYYSRRPLCACHSVLWDTKMAVSLCDKNVVEEGTLDHSWLMVSSLIGMALFHLNLSNQYAQMKTMLF